MRQKDQTPRKVASRGEREHSTGSAMSSPAGNDVYRSMVLAFRMSELQVGGFNPNVKFL